MPNTETVTERCACSATAHHPKLIVIESALRALGACPVAWSPPRPTSKDIDCSTSAAPAKEVR